jgi:TfoX N-terminal domain
MAYDEGLARRIREQLAELPSITEMRMFGGLAFLQHGNMLVGVTAADLVVRVGSDATDAALAKPGTRLFDITGRPMRGWVVVSRDVLAEDAALSGWIGDAEEFVSTLPPKD